MGLKVTWGYRHFESALRGAGNCLGNLCRAQPAGNSRLLRLPASASLEETCSDLSLRSTGLLGRDQEPRPREHRSTLSSILAFQRKRRAETGESVSGSYEGTVVSKHSKSCSSFIALRQPHQKSHWVSSLPWPSTAFGAVPAGTNIVGSETLGFTVLQDIRVSGLSSKDLAPRETPTFTQPVDRTLCQRLW